MKNRKGEMENGKWKKTGRKGHGKWERRNGNQSICNEK
jgi:hypothetical protein